MRSYAIVIALFATITVFGQDVTFKRFETNPIIKPEALGEDGKNINGPSLIKVPDWVSNRLGKYYLYFAHHQGTYIRLAYADNLKGPWKIHKPGALRIEDCRCKDGAGAPKSNASGEVYLSKGHIASPDVHIDEQLKQIILYYHCPLNANGKKGQYTLRATSPDGLAFASDTTILGESYFKVFEWNKAHYAIARAGQLYRSTDGGRSFEQGTNLFADIQTKENYARHVATKVHGNELLVFFTRIGDKPERILLSRIDLSPDWSAWKAKGFTEVAQPATAYEGANLPLSISNAGSFHGLVRELRDPGFYEEDGKWYLLYSVAGESGIGIAEIELKNKKLQTP
jgi:hypothetical protein